MESNEIQACLQKACVFRGAQLSGTGASDGWEVLSSVSPGTRIALRLEPSLDCVSFATRIDMPGAGGTGGATPPPAIDLLGVAGSAAASVDPTLAVAYAGGAAEAATLTGRVHFDGFTVQEASRMLAALERAPAVVQGAVRGVLDMARQSDELTRSAQEIQATMDEARRLEPDLEAALAEVEGHLAPPDAGPRVGGDTCMNPACRQPVTASTRFCSACGTPVGSAPPAPKPSAPGHCATCSQALVPGNGFCTGCGTPVG